MTDKTDTPANADITNAADTTSVEITNTDTTNEGPTLAEIMAEVQALKDHNSTLRNENKDLRKEKSKVAMDAAKTSGDVAAMQTLHDAELNARDQRIAELENTVAGFKKVEEERSIGDVISEAFTTYHVMDDMREPLKVFLANGVTMNDGKAIKDGLPLDMQLKAFFTSDRAKSYIAAPLNTGGGSVGSTANGSEWSAPPQDGEILSKWVPFMNANPARAKALAESWKRPDLIGN